MLALNEIVPAVVVVSCTLILMLPDGFAMNPLKEHVSIDWVLSDTNSVLAITVVPSHSLTRKTAVLASCTVTVPDANHVPDVPCATLGPSKNNVVLDRLTLADRELVNADSETASVPVPVMGPPVNPVPEPTLVTALAQLGVDPTPPV